MKSELPRISVVGLGKLGAPLAACLASKGFQVTGVDSDVTRVEQVNAGTAPVFEPGLDSLIQQFHARLTATSNLAQAIAASEITFILVPTPSEPGGAFSMQYILAAVAEIGCALQTKKGYHLVIVTSTVMPGATGNEVRPQLEKHSGKRCGVDFGLCYNPEFVALGSVIRDMLKPDLVLIGESDPRAGEMLEAVYRHFCDNTPALARMNWINAELTKLSLNTFVTTKISFANMLARLCEQLPGAEVDVVTAALGLDSRIGGKYLKGAVGYGGPCFPRDNSALAHLARRVGAPATLAEATDCSNREQLSHLTAFVKTKLPQGGTVGILGLAYKPDTDVVEKSQGLLLAEALLAEGIPVVAYDPAANENARRILTGPVRFANSAAECLGIADLSVLVTPWEEFRRLVPPVAEPQRKPRIIVDCWRILNPQQWSATAQYVALGVGLTEINSTTILEMNPS